MIPNKTQVKIDLILDLLPVDKASSVQEYIGYLENKIDTLEELVDTLSLTRGEIYAEQNDRR